MKRWRIVILLAWTSLLIQGAFTDSNAMQLKWLQVDCGTTNETLKEFNISALWRTDNGFIKKGQGQNKLLSMTKSPSQMNSLRFFPSGKRNCYKFPVTPKFMYLLRAGFYYGNYDGLLKPPTFDIEFDGNLWTTVVTNTSEEPFFHEVLYTAMREKVEVCLVQSIEGMVPFISSLQCIYVDYNVYDEMTDNKTAFYLRHRIRFGSDKQFGDLNRPDDDLFNRYWSPRIILNYHNVTSAFPPNGMSRYIDPPFEVLSYAIETNNVTSSIYIPIDFPSTSPLSAYIVLYFSSILTRPVETGRRTVQVEIDGHAGKNAEISPVYGTCERLTFYPVTVVGPANVTISAAEGTELPPMINAMEVFTAIEVSKGESSRKRTYSNSGLLLMFHALCLLLVSYL